MLIVSCGTTTFTEYRGPSLVEGKGGTVRNVGGIEFWENGDPNRKYRILGVINDSRDEGAIARSSRDGSIAKITRERGGDAVILVGNSHEYNGVDFFTKGPEYKNVTKLVVVKYLP
jgi:hypothetical protein